MDKLPIIEAKVRRKTDYQFSKDILDEIKEWAKDQPYSCHLTWLLSCAEKHVESQKTWKDM